MKLQEDPSDQKMRWLKTLIVFENEIESADCKSIRDLAKQAGLRLYTFD